MKHDLDTNNLARIQICAVIHSRVIRKSVPPKFTDLCMVTPCWCPCRWHQQGGRKVTETSVIEFCHQNEMILLKSSEISKSILLLEQELFSQPKLLVCPARERFQSDILMSRNAQTWKFRRTLLHNEEPCRAQTLQSAKFLEGLTYDQK